MKSRVQKVDVSLSSFPANRSFPSFVEDMLTDCGGFSFCAGVVTSVFPSSTLTEMRSVSFLSSNVTFS